MLTRFSVVSAAVSLLTRPTTLLRMEGAALLVVAALAYARLSGSWLAFFVLLLAPDAGMLGYLRDTKLGAATYNLVHTEALPLAVVAYSLVSADLAQLPLALIWLAHIGMDRLFGFGLKHPTAFKDTHLGRL